MKEFKFILIIIFILHPALIYSNSLTDSLKKKPRKKSVYPSIELLSIKVNELKNDERHAYSPARRWLALLTLIRENEIPKEEAIEKMENLIHDINDYLNEKNADVYPKDSWVFPIKGLQILPAGQFQRLKP